MIRAITVVGIDGAYRSAPCTLRRYGAASPKKLIRPLIPCHRLRRMDERADMALRHIWGAAGGVEALAICILPGHLHRVWRLAEGGYDFPGRTRQFKRAFTRALRAE